MINVDSTATDCGSWSELVVKHCLVIWFSNELCYRTAQTSMSFHTFFNPCSCFSPFSKV